MQKLNDLTGKRFGKLLAISYEIRKIKKGNKHSTCAYWTCACDCGKTHIVRGSELTQGKCNSCGCNKFVPPNKRTDREEYLWEDLYKIYTKRNKKFQLVGMWDITLKHFKYLCSQNCFYCEKEPSNNKSDYIKSGGIELKYSSLDRLYADKPYCLANVVPCCDTCNTAKASMTPEEWVIWIKRINSKFIESEKYIKILPTKKAKLDPKENPTFGWDFPKFAMEFQS